MGLYTISDYEDSDDEDEGDEEDDEPDDDKEQKESDEEKKEKLPDIGKIKLEDEKRLDGKKKHHHHREHDETKESRRARRRKQQQKAKRTIKDFRNKGGRIGFSEKNSELYTLLKEYSLVLRPEIKFCKYKLKKALKYKKDKAVRFWSKKIKELQEIFMLYQWQAVEIKLEANSTDIEKNTIDLHSLTLSEALLTVKEFIIKKRRELRESQDENWGFIEAKIITGKGKHSKNKAIIKPQVMKFLEENQILYQIGGTGGCLIVFITI